MAGNIPIAVLDTRARCRCEIRATGAPALVTRLGYYSVRLSSPAALYPLEPRRAAQVRHFTCGQTHVPLSSDRARAAVTKFSITRAIRLSHNRDRHRRLGVRAQKNVCPAAPEHEKYIRMSVLQGRPGRHSSEPRSESVSRIMTVPAP